VKTARIRTLIVVCLLGIGAAAAAAPADTIPVERIRPGMKGYGLTVFYGFKVERFNVEVIDVIKNFLPSQDLILARVDHPVLRHTGVVGGMSGSPIYFEGKLAGALAYGWRFAKDPICGITPIKNMLELTTRKLRGPSPWSASTGKAGDKTTLASLARLERWWKLPFGRAARPSTSEYLVPVAMPLHTAGFTPEAAVELRKAFASFGFEPVQGGGTGGADGPDKIPPGGAIGVQLVKGDMSMVGTGTATWVGGNRILAFGHRMFNAGEIYLPAVGARIHHMLANVSRSFKIASPAREVGSLVQDRQAGVMMDTSRRIGMVPMTVTSRVGGEKRVFHAQLARHRLLTGQLAGSVMMSSLAESLPDVDQATFKISTRVAVKGHRTIQLDDYLFSPGGIALTAALFGRGLRALREVMMNDFEPVFVERIDMDLDVKFGNDVLEINTLSLSSTTVDPGSRITLQVGFRPFAGKDFTRSYTVEIPHSLAGSVLQIEAASGSMVQPERAVPENLDQLLEALQESYPARSLVLSIGTPFEGLKLRGQVIRDLPSSVLDSFNTAAVVRNDQAFHPVLRTVHHTQRVLSGRKSIRIRVRSEVNQ
jgi:hypothetical protein